MKITPRTIPVNTVDFEKLKSGNTFLHQGSIWIKIDDHASQVAVNLHTGERQVDMYGDIVVPVDTILTWKRKKVTAKKK